LTKPTRTCCPTSRQPSIWRRTPLQADRHD